MPGWEAEHPQAVESLRTVGLFASRTSRAAVDDRYRGDNGHRPAPGWSPGRLDFRKNGQRGLVRRTASAVDSGAGRLRCSRTQRRNLLFRHRY